MTDMPGKLTAWLRTQLPGDDLRIEGLDRVEFGHSAEMMVLTIVTGADRRDVVVRLRPRPPALLEPYDLKRQFDILRSLEATPVRAPRALWLEDTGDVLGRPFFVMERVPGDVYEMQTPEATPERIHRMCLSMAEQLAAVHRVDLDATGLHELDDGEHSPRARAGPLGRRNAPRPARTAAGTRASTRGVEGHHAGAVSLDRPCPW